MDNYTLLIYTQIQALLLMMIGFIWHYCIWSGVTYSSSFICMAFTDGCISLVALCALDYLHEIIETKITLFGSHYQLLLICLAGISATLSAFVMVRLRSPIWLLAALPVILLSYEIFFNDMSFLEILGKVVIFVGCAIASGAVTNTTEKSNFEEEDEDNDLSHSGL